MNKKTIFILSVLFSLSSSSSSVNYALKPPSSTDTAIRRLYYKTIEVVNQLWNTLNDPQRLTILRGKGPAASTILEVFSDLRGDLFASGNRIEDAKIERDLRSLAFNDEISRWKPLWEELSAILGKVNLLFSYLDEYMEQAASSEAPEKDVIQDYASSIVQPQSTETSLYTALSHLHNIIANRNLFNDLMEVIKEKDGKHICDIGQSPHQIIYNLYNVIALAEIKGYAMIQFSYMMLKLYGKGNFTVETDLAEKSFKSQATEKLVTVKAILPKLSKDVWKCDASNPVEGTTYLRMTNLLQGYIENEVDMNPSGSCKDKCSSYTVAENQGCYGDGLFCDKQPPCEGRLFDCQFFDADAWICLNNDGDKYRRYNWIEYEDGTILGNKRYCQGKLKVDSWWRLLYHCSYCLCKCDAPDSKSDRYWSLEPVLSNIDENKIVTGIRFVKKNRILTLEIQEAVAVEEGWVNERTKVWKEADISTEIDPKNEDVDYMKMSYEQRAIDMDKLKAPEGHVITGLKFRNIGGHLNLEARVTPIQFSTGKLLRNASTWIGNDNTTATKYRRDLVEIIDPDVPTHFVGHSVINTKHNQYVLFDASSVHKDVMQTTVPYIDAQPVTTTTGTWLSGVGLYHKGHAGFGGYIGISISTFDFSNHLLPSQNAKYEFAQKKRQNNIKN